MKGGFILVIRGHLVRVDARFAAEHALAEEPQSSRRFRWWHLEPEALTTAWGAPLQRPSPPRRRRPIK